MSLFVKLPKAASRLSTFFFSCACLLFVVDSGATEFSSLVVSVIDGDTIKVLHENHSERIRLSGIDCPEKEQAYGKKAKQAASELVFGKEVTLRLMPRIKHGRTIADVLLPNGTNVNQQLVKEGWCWWYQKYASNDLALKQSEQEAKAAKLDAM